MKTYITFTFLLIVASSYSQTISKSVIGSAGKTTTSGGTTISWTVGEPVVGLMTAGGNQLGNGYYPALNLELLATENQELETTITVFPNPTTNFLTIKHAQNHNLTIIIYDVTGKIIKQTNLVSSDQVDVSLFPNGIYLLNVIDLETNQKSTYKIIKE